MVRETQEVKQDYSEGKGHQRIWLLRVGVGNSRENRQRLPLPDVFSHESVLICQHLRMGVNDFGMGIAAHTDRMGYVNVSQRHGKYGLDSHRIFDAPFPDLDTVLFRYYKCVKRNSEKLSGSPTFSF